MTVLNPKILKNSNKNKLLNIVYNEKEITKSELSKRLNLSIPTVTTILDSFIEQGLVKEAGVALSTGGRKPAIIKFNENSRYSIGVEIDKECIRVIIINLYGEIIIDNKKLIKEFSEHDVIDKLIDLIQYSLNILSFEKDFVLGIGFSLPGIINDKNYELKLATNLKLKNLSFKLIGEKLSLPIFLENEANAGALAELKLGYKNVKRNIIYLSIDDGVGAGLILNNNLYRGADKKAGEIGHMIICEEGNLCSCGNRGCFETYASNIALIRDYNMLTGNHSSSLEDIFEKYTQNDSLAQRTINDYLKFLCTGLKNLILIFNPDAIIIGGKISKYGNLLIDQINNNIFANNNFYKQGDVTILFSSLGENSSILGAAYMPIKNILGI
jgi:predicted NBD/HSP70 family sugar kinase